MSKVYVLIYQDYDCGTCIHSVHKTKEGARQAKINKEKAFGIKEQSSFFDIDTYELHE